MEGERRKKETERGGADQRKKKTWRREKVCEKRKHLEPLANRIKDQQLFNLLFALCVKSGHC